MRHPDNQWRLSTCWCLFVLCRSILPGGDDGGLRPKTLCEVSLVGRR
jgi:hypothetical protein